MSIAKARTANTSGRKRRKRRIWEFRYPRLCNWLIFSRLTDGRWDVFDDAREKHFLLDGRTVRYIRRLDGKNDPFRISRSFSPDEVKVILRFLLENHLLRRGRIRRLSSGFLGFFVWIPSRSVGRNRGIFRCLNLLLTLFFLPVFGLGIWINLRSPSVSPGVSIPGVLFGIIVSTVLHEFGHAAACLACGGQLFEAGVGVGFLRGFGYTMMETDGVGSRAKKAQVFAAGIETDLLLCGVFLALCAASHVLACFCANAAQSVFLLTVFNILPVSGLDGGAILGELTGTGDPLRHLVGFMIRPEVREKTLHGDACKKLTFLISSILILTSPFWSTAVFSRFMALFQG